MHEPERIPLTPDQVALDTPVPAVIQTPSYLRLEGVAKEFESATEEPGTPAERLAEARDEAGAVAQRTAEHRTESGRTR